MKQSIKKMNTVKMIILSGVFCALILPSCGVASSLSGDAKAKQLIDGAIAQKQPSLVQSNKEARVIKSSVAPTSCEVSGSLSFTLEKMKADMKIDSANSQDMVQTSSFTVSALNNVVLPEGVDIQGTSKVLAQSSL